MTMLMTLIVIGGCNVDCSVGNSDDGSGCDDGGDDDHGGRGSDND